MSAIILRAGAILVIAGVVVVTGYWLYYAFKALFSEPSIPLAIKVAIPAIIIGIILLLSAVGWERYRKGKEERFEEVEE
ncbi:MAG: hypothetical protein ABID84_01090 [Chloroflexota bacterium]